MDKSEMSDLKAVFQTSFEMIQDRGYFVSQDVQNLEELAF